MEKTEGTQEKDSKKNSKKNMEGNVSREITSKEMEKVTGGTVTLPGRNRKPL